MVTSEREIAEALKPKIAIQCAKSAILISSLKNTTLDSASINKNNQNLKSKIALHCAQFAILISSIKNTTLNSPNINKNNNEEYLKEVEELKMEIFKQKLKNKKLKLCSVTELLIQVIVLLSVWTMLLLLAFN